MFDSLDSKILLIFYGIFIILIIILIGVFYNKEDKLRQEECLRLCNGSRVELYSLIERAPPGPKNVLVCLCADFRDQSMMRIQTKILDLNKMEP